MKLFSSSSKNTKKIHPEKVSYISYIFSKESFSYISGNENPEKNSVYFRKRKPWKNFLYLRKGIFRTLA